MTADRRFACTYTAQLTKKSKAFKDGLLVLSADGRRASLYDVANRGAPLEVNHRSSPLASLTEGDELTWEYHIVRVDEETSTVGSGAAATVLPAPILYFPRPTFSSAKPLSSPSPQLSQSSQPRRAAGLSLQRPRVPLHPLVRPKPPPPQPSPPTAVSHDGGEGPRKKAKMDPLWGDPSLAATTAPGLRAVESKPAPLRLADHPMLQLLSRPALPPPPPLRPSAIAEQLPPALRYDEEEDEDEALLFAPSQSLLPVPTPAPNVKS